MKKLLNAIHHALKINEPKKFKDKKGFKLNSLFAVIKRKIKIQEKDKNGEPIIVDKTFLEYIVESFYNKDKNVCRFFFSRWLNFRI